MRKGLYKMLRNAGVKTAPTIRPLLGRYHRTLNTNSAGLWVLGPLLTYTVKRFYNGYVWEKLKIEETTGRRKGQTGGGELSSSERRL